MWRTETWQTVVNNFELSDDIWELITDDTNEQIIVKADPVVGKTPRSPNI